MVQQENGEGMETLPDRISATFAGKTVFITGGTGFIGKVLVEKLLRKCPDIVQIILFIRTKKDKTPQQRLQIIFNDPLFEKVANMRGGLNKLLEKIKVVEGDASAPDLGIRSSDRQYITDNVDIIVHAAATVRFDEPLKTAVILNVRCTKLVLELAKECKHLKVK
ncbi:fatty acyl-CoA reductase wat-like [Hyposmocoma kahamanoa]|uniref:fatty acyl-CoA reductase wat-like n=1 Tax=Hyposmocoma kahamanoa TaxID=1477025 RepID=UPI000E6D696B|nr:fatty acyl-CoA reductase wat-like [Hyposmocoma kahamanoa]